MYAFHATTPILQFAPTAMISYAMGVARHGNATIATSYTVLAVEEILELIRLHGVKQQATEPIARLAAPAAD
jgi:transketolase C-terminal domain/subunit